MLDKYDDIDKQEAKIKKKNHEIEEIENDISRIQQIVIEKNNQDFKLNESSIQVTKPDITP